MVGASNKYINHKNTKSIWWLVSFLTNLFPSWQEMLPCGSSCGEINVISYQPFSIMPCMHLESYGDLNFKLRHIIYEGWSSPVHRQSVDHFKRLFENPQTCLFCPQNYFSVLPVSRISTFMQFFGLSYLRFFIIPEISVELWHISYDTVLGVEDAAVSKRDEALTITKLSFHWGM